MDDPIDVLADLTQRVTDLSDTVRAFDENLSEMRRQIGGQIAEHGRVSGQIADLVNATLGLHADVRRALDERDDHDDRIRALERKVHRLSEGVHMSESEPPAANGNGRA